MRVQGYFRILNFFDIGEALELERLRTLLGPAAAPRSPAFVHHTPEYAQAQNVPVIEPLGSVTLPTGEKLERPYEAAAPVGETYSLKIKPDTDLTFPAWQILRGGSEGRCSALQRLYSSCVVSIEQIKRFKKDLPLDALPDIESLRDAHIHVHGRRRGLRVSSVQRIAQPVEVETLPIEQATAIEIGSTVCG